MTPEQKKLVKSTWAAVVPIADTAAGLFYGRLFETDPSTRPMFQSTDMSEQRKKLMQALIVVVNGIDDLGQIIPTVEQLARRHLAYGVKDRTLRLGRSRLVVDPRTGSGRAMDAGGQRGMVGRLWHACRRDARSRSGVAFDAGPLPCVNL